MVERSIAWLVRDGNRKIRYRRIANNALRLHHRLAALDLRRLINLGLHQQHRSFALARQARRAPPRRSLGNVSSSRRSSS
jgi:hypothetical protein